MSNTIDDILKQYKNEGQSGSYTYETNYGSPQQNNEYSVQRTSNVTYSNNPNPEIEKILAETRKSQNQNEILRKSGVGEQTNITVSEYGNFGGSYVNYQPYETTVVREENIKRSGVPQIQTTTYENTYEYQPSVQQSYDYKPSYETTVVREENIKRSGVNQVPTSYESKIYEVSSYDYKPSEYKNYDFKPSEYVTSNVQTTYEGREDKIKRSGVIETQPQRVTTVYETSSYQPADYKTYEVKKDFDTSNIKPYDYRSGFNNEVTYTTTTNYAPPQYDYKEYQPKVEYQPPRVVVSETVKRGGLAVASNVVVEKSTNEEQNKINMMADEIERRRNLNGELFKKLSSLQNERSEQKSILISRENEIVILKSGNVSDLKRVLQEKDAEIAALKNRSGSKISENREEIESLLIATRNKEYENEQLKTKIAALDVETRDLKIKYGKNRETNQRGAGKASEWCC